MCLGGITGANREDEQRTGNGSERALPAAQATTAQS